jgi:Ca2+-transporting ATPase
MEGKRIIAAKGGPETIIKVSNLKTENSNKLRYDNYIDIQGISLLGVAILIMKTSYPKTNRTYLSISGLVVFYDPPKPNINSVIQNSMKRVSSKSHNRR